MRSIKHTDRAFFLGLQADAKEFPGGIRALAEMIGVNGNTMSNGLNPDHDAPPPSLSVIVEVIKLAQAKRSVFALAQMCGQVPIDIDIDQVHRVEAVAMFLALINKASGVLGTGSEFASDGRFDALERRELEPLLFSLLKATAELLHAIRG